MFTARNNNELLYYSSSYENNQNYYTCCLVKQYEQVLGWSTNIPKKCIWKNLIYNNFL